MAPRIQHPFAVDVRAPRRGRQGYTWSIRQGGEMKRRSALTYRTFEEARVAMKAALVGLVAAWEAAR